MQDVSVPLVQKLQRSVDVQSKARVIADWNYNRFINNVTVTNGSNPSSGEFDNELFPLSSIAEPDRPKRGIVKALVDEAYVVGPYQDSGASVRYVVASEDDLYKYWTSPGESAASAPHAISTVDPTVVYGSTVMANKIVIGLENSYSSPSAYEVFVTTDGATWTSVSTNPTIGPEGTIELYHQEDDTWTTTPTRDYPTSLKGVRLSVTEMDQGGVKFNLIELGLHREDDLSDYVVNYTVDSNMSETSFVTPIGRASSNEATVEFDNTSMVFSNAESTSPYKDILEKNVLIYIDLGINIGTYDTPDYEWVRQFTGRSVVWNGQTRDGTTVTISDDSERLQLVNPPKALFEKVTATEVIWRILDSVGFSAWEYDPLDVDMTMIMESFWCDGTQTVWEVIAEVAEVSQTAVYFDEYGILQIMPRYRAYNLTNDPVWQLDAVVDGLKLPDIVSLETSNEFEANTVGIEYTPTSLSEVGRAGYTPMEVVWEPEDTVALRSSQMTKSINDTGTWLYINPTESQTWPYTSMVQVEGEFMRYTHKEYAYYDAAGVKRVKNISSGEEKATLDKLNPDKYPLNAFTGKFIVPQENRGLWRTKKVDHSVTLSRWNSKRYNHNSGGMRSWSGGWKPNPGSSYVRLQTNSSWRPSTWYTCTQGSYDDYPVPRYYGARLRIQNVGDGGSAGIVIGAGDNDTGYFIELKRTASIDDAYRQKYNHELWVCYKYSENHITRLGKGAEVTILDNVWYDLDVMYYPGTTHRSFVIAVNGVTALSVGHTASIPAKNRGSRSGIFVRNYSTADFEYFYAYDADSNPSFDEATWWD